MPRPSPPLAGCFAHLAALLHYSVPDGLPSLLCRLALARESGEAEPSAPYRLAPAAASGSQQQEQQQQQDASSSAEQRGLPPPPPPSPPPQQQQGVQEQQEQQKQENPQEQQPSRQEQQQPSSLAEQQAAALASLDASLQQLWDASPAGTMLVVVTGQGDTSYSRWVPALLVHVFACHLVNCAAFLQPHHPPLRVPCCCPACPAGTCKSRSGGGSSAWTACRRGTQPVRRTWWLCRTAPCPRCALPQSSRQSSQQSSRCRRRSSSRSRMRRRSSSSNEPATSFGTNRRNTMYQW